jgi:thiosulfate oxidation carrier complex protein SoxZ
MKETLLRLRRRGSRTEVLVLVKHAMEPGSRVDQETGQAVPADYIDRMTFALNGNPVAEARLGPGVAGDPLTAIALESIEPGDEVAVSWRDVQGDTGHAAVVAD